MAQITMRLASFHNDEVVVSVIVDDADVDASVPPLMTDEGPDPLWPCRVLRVLIDLAPGRAVDIGITSPRTGRVIIDRTVTSSLDERMRGQRVNVADVFSWRVRGV